MTRRKWVHSNSAPSLNTLREEIVFMGHPWPPFHSFSVFSNKHNKFYNKLMWNSLSSARIPTHNILYMSHLLWPLDQGSHPKRRNCFLCLVYETKFNIEYPMNGITSHKKLDQCPVVFFCSKPSEFYLIFYNYQNLNIGLKPFDN